MKVIFIIRRTVSTVHELGDTVSHRCNTYLLKIVYLTGFIRTAMAYLGPVKRALAPCGTILRGGILSHLFFKKRYVIILPKSRLQTKRVLFCMLYTLLLFYIRPAFFIITRNYLLLYKKSISVS